MTHGRFITFEGIDGCGKSTQAELLAQSLKKKGSHVVQTREPGGTPLAEKIRALLIDPGNSEMVDECELLLYLAARAQHVREKVVPLVNLGTIVICDRFQDATFAYQGFGRGISLEFLQQLNSYATGIAPHCTFIFDLPVEIAFERMRTMNKAHDRIESAGKQFFEKIREGYLRLADAFPERIVVMDGTLPKDVLAGSVYEKTISVLS